MNNALRHHTGNLVHKLGEIQVGGVVSAVGYGAYCYKSNAMVMAHLRHGSALHFYRQRLMASGLQPGHQRSYLLCTIEIGRASCRERVSSPV